MQIDRINIVHSIQRGRFHTEYIRLILFVFILRTGTDKTLTFDQTFFLEPYSKRDRAIQNLRNFPALQ